MEEPIVLKLFLIGFHHKKGCDINSEYPKEDSNRSYEIDIESLPSLCLPDQSHNFLSDSVYFVLPNSKDSKRIFGVSCFRQIETEKLTNRTENDGTEFSRSSVQKAVCCLSRLPLFGYIEVKLNIIVDKIFEQENFNCNELLKESYNELNRCLSLRINPSDDEIFISSHEDFVNDFYIGICLRELIILWKHKILVLFKLLLLEKRILFYGSPVKPLCTIILSLISLHPQLLNKGLCDVFDLNQTQINNAKNIVSKEEENISNEEKIDEVDGTKQQQQQQQPIYLQNIDSNDYFAPLNIFKNGYLCLPFISLQYIDIIADKAHNGFIAGASNVLFQQKKSLFDIIVDVPSQTIDFIDLELKKCIQLSTEDLRFFDHIWKGVESPKADSGIGTDMWIRKQFESYFVSMLKTNYDSDNQRESESFNEYFMEDWKKTNNYQDWLAKKITFTSNCADRNSFDAFSSGHPFSRTTNTINVTDVKNKIVQSINNTPTARKTVTAVTNTFSNAKSTFSSWLSNLSVKEEITKDMISMEECEKAESDN